MNAIQEVIEYLEDWMIEPTTENIIKVLNEWCNNLYSHIGKEAHEQSLKYGIVDETGINWEEQDGWTLNKIKEYKKCIAELEEK